MIGGCWERYKQISGYKADVQAEFICQGKVNSHKTKAKKMKANNSDDFRDVAQPELKRDTNR